MEGKTEYIIRRGNEYIVAIAWNAKGTNNPVYSIYRYDAVKIPDLNKAKNVVKKLAKEGENWSIESLKYPGGETKTVWTWKK